MGRTSLILVMGFNIIFATMGYNLSHVATNAYQNFIDYYDQSVSHTIAASAANIAASQICFSPNTRPAYSNIPFEGGTYSVSSVDVAGGTQIKVTATATYNSSNATIILLLGLTKFSKFAYYSQIEGGINWISGDTVWGPFHTQQKLTVNGHPVFYGKASAKNGISMAAGSNPEFHPDFQSGVDINLPVDLSQVKSFAQSGGAYFNSGNDVYLRFNSDSTATYRLGSWTAIPSYTVPLTTLAPNGVLMVNGANLHLKGVLSGQITVGSLGSSGASKGNVWIDSSVVYNKNPLTDPTSRDMLGIVCDNNVIVADNANNDGAAPTYGTTIMASLLCRTGGLGAENYNGRPVSGTLTLLGGVQQYQRGAVGQFSSQTGAILNGFQKNYRYDSRLMIGSPPLYPTTGTYEVLSWYE